MRRVIRVLMMGAVVVCVALGPSARAEQQGTQTKADQDLQKRLDDLTKEIDGLKRQVKRDEDKSLSRWLTLGGDYRFRIDSLYGSVPNYWQYMGPGAMPAQTPGYDPKNTTLMTNRFGLNMKAKATEDVTLTSRLLMYKTFGMENASATNAGFFADRTYVLDGTIGHIPLDNTLRVDQVYVTWNNIGGEPVWFSVGRRPSTGGSPTFVRQDAERPGAAGVPGLLVDYAFDGMTLGYAPEINSLPGFFAKLCYGRGFDAGYNISPLTGRSNSMIADTEMLGVQIVPVDTDPLRIDFQWNRGFNIFDNPANVGADVGDMDWYGVDVLSTLKNVGPGTLTWFVSGGMSVSHPNGNQALSNGPGSPASGAGLLVNGTDTSSHVGYSLYVGGRYDLASGTKIGLEYNHGSQYWMPFDPAADDMWTSKLGTRGNVYEVYLIQELPLKPISSYLSKVFFRLGYQYYDFTYTGSNNWIGAPVKMSDVSATPMNAQMFPPVKSAHDIYGTFEVRL